MATSKLQGIIDSLPNEIQLVDENGKPFDEDIVIVLDDDLKYNFAYIMLETGEDLETAVRNTLSDAIESFKEDFNA